jgi:hypothetical protein
MAVEALAEAARWIKHAVTPEPVLIQTVCLNVPAKHVATMAAAVFVEPAALVRYAMPRANAQKAQGASPNAMGKHAATTGVVGRAVFARTLLCVTPMGSAWNPK